MQVHQRRPGEPDWPEGQGIDQDAVPHTHGRQPCGQGGHLGVVGLEQGHERGDAALRPPRGS